MLIEISHYFPEFTSDVATSRYFDQRMSSDMSSKPPRNGSRLTNDAPVRDRPLTV
jgi:hypothetical protein